MKSLFKKLILVLSLCLMLSPITSHAASTTGEMDRYPNVTLSPDGSKRAWTTDAGNKSDERLPYQYTVDMHAEPTLGETGPGEHYYGKKAEGSVTISKWVVMHTPGQCIHGPTVTLDTFAGFTYSNSICHAYYNNGWFGYCVDCGELAAAMLVYARENTVSKITSIPATSTYVYLCPHCTHLEQGYRYEHICKAISSNRYRVTYRPNPPEDSTVAGYMAPTMHMYDNSATYNGESVKEIGYTDTSLRLNSFTSTGYVFVGWNTEADGSGLGFSDGQEVLNLTTQENGTVRLYAQWKKAEGSLLLDANGGTYKGQAVYTQKQKYGTTYQVENGQIVPPTGYKVRFETNGGAAVGTITTTKSFTHWQIQSGFSGEFKNDTYRYLGADGNQDVIKAQYVDNGFKLPDCSGVNASLVGWYNDPDLSDDAFVGKAGDAITVDKDTVLYAKWETLTLWAYDDYTSHGGVGAVDLKWEQKDGKGKFYRLYQSEDKANWKEIFSGSDILSSASVLKEYGVSEQGKNYTIPYTGNYTLIAFGAKGGDYNAYYTGGKGGKVSVTYWLSKGDVLSVYPGSEGSGLNGGSNGNGADGGSSTSELGRGGGAATQIYLTRNGSKTLLITAGGGGGANAGNSGGNGGTGGGASGQVGAAGIGAGGGGHVGGLCGEFSYHTHGNDCGYHTHTGNTTSGGACYTDKVTQSVYCGDSEEYVQGPCSWWWDPANNRCIRCHGTDPNTLHYGDRCDNCGADTGGGAHYKTQTYYKLTCETKEGWQCGKTDGEVESIRASVGGTSYASNSVGSKSVSLTAGVNDGAGKVIIQSEDIGYTEETSLSDVLARDKKAPGNIPGYEEALSGEEICRITVKKPEDFGTVYYHKAESYESGTVKKLATSNVTENRLVSGVAGYRYFVSSSASGTVTASHSWTTNNWVDVTMKSTVQYLHMAAVDVAGNIGPTLHVAIKTVQEAPEITPDPEYMENISLKTEQVLIEDTEFVYPAGTEKYYVKADGVTEHVLNLSAYTEGNVSNHYQIDTLRMVSEWSSMQEWYQVKIPRINTNAGVITFSNEQLQTDASAEQLGLLEPVSGEAERTDKAKYVSLKQRVRIPVANDAKPILVYPKAMADYQDMEYWSEHDGDYSHRIVLIPDGRAPVISGVEALENAGNIDMTEESKDFVIRAFDDGSGVRNLVVTITNLDNRMQRTYSSDTGELTITMEREDYLFLGDFVVSTEASDRVGNVNLKESDSLAFTLEAELTKVRPPYNTDFKAGDGASLMITTGGYADKVIIGFPDSLTTLNPELDREYIYEYPAAIKTEVYEFNIPLSASKGSYVICIEAWKNGRKLTEELELTIRTNGSIIEELRTRIRDNGV